MSYITCSTFCVPYYEFTVPCCMLHILFAFAPGMFYISCTLRSTYYVICCTFYTPHFPFHRRYSTVHVLCLIFYVACSSRWVERLIFSMFYVCYYAMLFYVLHSYVLCVLCLTRAYCSYCCYFLQFTAIFTIRELINIHNRQWKDTS